jgi:excisionase family DNA binding protein
LVETKSAENQTGLPDYQAVIDDALRLVYSHHSRLMRQLYPQAFGELTMDQLRSGPLGRDLKRLAALAQGQTREDKEHVVRAIESVLQLLFWPAAADDYSVPRTFWDTELGKMMARAKYLAYEPGDLISIGAAADVLKVTRPTIYRWMDERTLNYVRDATSGRTFVIKSDIENLKEVASHLNAHASGADSY